MKLPERSQNANRIALRFALRSIRRRKARSLLIATMVAIPIAGLAGFATVYASLIPTDHEKLTTTLGRTQAMIQVTSPPDATLMQNPVDAADYYRDITTNGIPTAYDEDDELVAPSSYIPERMLVLRTTNVIATTRFGSGGFQTVQGDAGSPELAGRFTLIDGQPPTRASEVAVSPAALDRLGAEVGDTFDVTEPRRATVTIVGVMRDRQADAGATVLFATDGALDGVPAESDLATSTFFLPETIVDENLLTQINANGAVVTSRWLHENPPSGARWNSEFPLSGLFQLVVLVGIFALFQVCLLSGSAFLVGTRADLRSLAMLASVGADRRVVFRSVAFGGLFIGLVGGIVGAAVGAVGAWFVFQALDDGNRVTYPGFHLHPWLLLAIVGFGVASGWISASVGARSAARTDIALAMRGARKPARPSKRRPIFGAVTALVGIGIILLGGGLAYAGAQPFAPQILTDVGILSLAVGAIVVQVGAILAIGWLLHLFARVFGGGSTAARLASRDNARNSPRAVPIVAAVMTTVFVVAFILTFLASAQATMRFNPDVAVGRAIAGFYDFDEEQGIARSAAPPEDVARLVQSVFPDSEVRTISGAMDAALTGTNVEHLVRPTLAVEDCGLALEGADCRDWPYFLSMTWGGGSHLTIGSAADYELLTGESLDREGRDVLASGGAVALYPEYVKDQQLTIEWVTQQPTTTDGRQPTRVDRSETLTAIVREPSQPVFYGVLISEKTARDLGIPAVAGQVVADIGREPTPAENDAINAGLLTLSVPQAETLYFHYSPPRPDFAGQWSWLLVGLAFLIMLASSATAIGLARADARRDDEVLDAVGSPRELRRGIAFWQALVVAGIGGAVGTAIALLPNLALTIPYLGKEVAGNAFAPPWLQLALLGVGIPLAIAAASWATAGTRLRVRRAR